ncbi:MAG: secondary thiamine-phosphate synthase [Betaproteobacteria bacterium RIFCSPLOWO2_02_FULL_62_17]|nr:MAG: secondary thiamine-phosphate synthase [Betaproteobacteria bacterium RIFCSPLOWO2_02_FULL_62_17]
MIAQEHFSIDTRGRGMVEITRMVAKIVRQSGVRTGLCNVFVRHTSASLILSENADPAVLADLETVLAGLAPDGDPRYVHDAEGPDDMAAHIRAVLTDNSINIPVTDGNLALGTWQGLYLWEHRLAPHTRRLIVTVNGEA